MKKRCDTLFLWSNLSFFLLFISTPALGQYYNYPINSYSQYFLEQGDSTLNGSFRSLPESWHELKGVRGYTDETYYSELGEKLFNDHLISLEKDDFQVYIDLLLHFEVGREFSDTTSYSDTTLLYRNMRGFSVKGNIGKKVSFETTFREIQSTLPRYLYDYTEQSGVVPGQGRTKPFANGAFDHNIAEGYVSYEAAEWLNIQFGSQRNFIGSGRRSLLLSDNAFTYPQVKLNSRFLDGRLRYHVIQAWLQTLDRLPRGDSPESLFAPKSGSFKYLEFQPIDEVSIGLFEGFIWDGFDALEGTKSPPLEAYLPIIGLNSVLDGLTGEDSNGLIGFDVVVKPIQGIKVFGQYAADGKDQNGYQLGARTNSLLLEGLSINLEYNSTTASAYGASNPALAYTHYNQPLAHPMGSGFSETRLDLLYFYKRLFLDASIVNAQTSSKSDLGYTGDQLFTALEENGFDLKERDLFHIDARIGYFFNPKSNFNAYLGWMYRTENRGTIDDRFNMFKFGIEMSLMNTYEDF
jgi:hypothetical protein